METTQRKFSRYIIAAVIVLFAGQVYEAPVWAGESDTGGQALNYGFGTDFFTKYIWRGQNYGNDHVLEPWFSVNHKSITAMIWANYELTNISGNSGDFSEVDLVLDHSSKLPGVDGVNYSLGVAYYDFPGTHAKDTTEVYAGLNLEAPLAPSVTFYYDVDEVEGTYVLYSMSHCVQSIIKFSPDAVMGLKVGAGIGWGSGSYNKYYWAEKHSKFNDLTLSVAFPTEISGWTLTPSVSYIALLSDSLRENDIYSNDSDFVMLGVGLFKAF